MRDTFINTVITFLWTPDKFACDYLTFSLEVMRSNLEMTVYIIGSEVCVNICVSVPKYFTKQQSIMFRCSLALRIIFMNRCTARSLEWPTAMWASACSFIIVSHIRPCRDVRLRSLRKKASSESVSSLRLAKVRIIVITFIMLSTCAPLLHYYTPCACLLYHDHSHKCDSLKQSIRVTSSS